VLKHDTLPIPTITDLEVAIRPAVAADLPKLEWFGQYAHYRAVFRRTFDDHLAGKRLALVADLNDYPIGQLFIQFAAARAIFADGRARAYLYALRVMPSFQRRGIGTRLIRAAERALLSRGYQWSTIAVAKDNTGARRLYERLGYRIFTDDPGRWHYVDQSGCERLMVEPSWVLEKNLRSAAL
jgi:ribosomal protein S18 acetylase RimI-like enzyme